MPRSLPLAAALLLAGACTFEGGGLAPFTPSAPAPAEEDLEIPYVPTPRPVVTAMLDMAGVGPGDHLIDLGSGDGRIAIMAAQRGARALGVDLDPDRIAEANRAAGLAQVQDLARFRRQDLFATPLREADVVTLYLLPHVNLRLRPRLLTELRPGARVVSHNFAMGDWQPDETRELGASRAFLWIVPAPAAGQWTIEEEGGARRALLLEQRFQEVSGSLDGRPLRDVTLRGRSLAFIADLADGSRLYSGVVGDAEILPDPQAGDGATGWRARRIG